MNSEATIWTPKWWVTILVIAGFFGLFALAASGGKNPFLTLDAAFRGAIGGGLGTILGVVITLFLKPSEERSKWIILGAAVLGFVLDKFVGAGATAGVNATLGSSEARGIFLFQTLVGASIGAVIGLLLQATMNKRSEKFGAISFYTATFFGGLGGAILAIPAAIFLYAFGVFKYKSKP